MKEMSWGVGLRALCVSSALCGKKTKTTKIAKNAQSPRRKNNFIK